MPTWSPQQEKALKDIGVWARSSVADSNIFILQGDAGTGKTTLAHEVKNDLESMGKRCKAYAYTGKAASVLRDKGFDDASTIHADLYVPASVGRDRLEELQSSLHVAQNELANSEDEAEQKALRESIAETKRNINFELKALSNPLFNLNTASPILDLDFIIVDEMSMLGTTNGTDLFEMCKLGGVKMLVMGDPNQLPPVKDKAYFMNMKVNAHLTEIHRQAKDNPILHLAHLARNRERIPLGSYGESRVVSHLQAQEALECDQVLCGLNRTRMYYNWTMRKERGYAQETEWRPDPDKPKRQNLVRLDSGVEIGEKLMCLRNSKEGYFNGSVWYVDDVLGPTSDGTRVCLDIRSEDVSVPSRQALVHCKTLRGEEIHFMDAQGAQSMVSAQAVTVHKFQGSEGDHIVLLDESRAAARDDWNKWLYTGITRARKRITIVVDDD